jgi:CRISPR/Cas system-associated exonuclease Cas4 (RecB family)
MSEWWQIEITEALQQVRLIDAHYLLYSMLVISTFIVVNDVLRAIKKRETRTGLNTSKSFELTIDGSKRHQVKTYISEIQGISGRPDAVILENGFFIPVERKPIGNKVRDRHIAQLLVYMRLIEEFEGKKPPYGYLIIGKSARKVKIYNTPERQNWLSIQLDEMKQIVADKTKAVAQPQKNKCAHCKVQDHCESRFSTHSSLNSIQAPREEFVLINPK